MGKNLLIKNKFIIIILIILSFINILNAKENKTQDKIKDRGFFGNILRDELSIWGSPAKLKTKDLVFWVPVITTTAILIVNDERIYRGFKNYQKEHSWIDSVSPQITKLGDGTASVVISGLFYIGGLAFNDKRAKETASLGFQVLIHTGIMVQAGKHLFGRTRPGATGGVDHWSGISGFFKRYNEGFTHYDSFPSGHTITVWGMATVIAEEYKEKPLIPIISYTLATAAGLSRVTEDAHWLSDVFVGAVLGWTIGKFIVRRRGRKWQVTPFASTNSIGINLIYSGF
jgi:membrane-associated phospholipid phosphatase